jgi:ribosomal RNA-processing protein 12
VLTSLSSSPSLIRFVQEIAKAFEKVTTLFKDNLTDALPMTQDDKQAGRIPTTAQDILLLLLPFLSPSASAALFELCLTNEVLGGKDGGLQKRGYKILTKLVESKKVVTDPEVILRQLEEFVPNLAPAAKKVSDLDLLQSFSSTLTMS